jgi:hypothetical protein
MANGGDEVAVKMLDIAKEITFNAILRGKSEGEADALTLAKRHAAILAEVYSILLKAVSPGTKG